MQILLIHQAFASLDEPGGTRHHELARYLAFRGHQITIIASPVSYLTGLRKGEKVQWVIREEGGTGIHVLRAYTYSALHRSFVHRIFSFISFMVSSFLIGLSVRPVDLIWGTSPPIFQGVTAWALSRLKRVPFLFEVRDLWPAFAVAIGVLRQPLLIRASEWLERFLYRHADLVVVNSPGFIEHVLARGAREVKLVPNGSDASMFSPDLDGSSLRQEWELQDKFIALYAGAHGLSNDLGVILSAADLLREQTGIAIVLLGDGKDKPALMAQASKMHLSNLHFIAPLPKNVMPVALAASNACIGILKPIPLYATVYPNKVFDYMAAGRPVILAIDGVIRNLIDESKAGIFVEPGNAQALAAAILHLATHPQDVKEMGLNGRKVVEERYNRPLLADHLAQMMEDLVIRYNRSRG
jgi:glycosyltransferase involved in cell wall biosynthesis